MNATNFNAQDYLNKIKEANPNTYQKTDDGRVFVGENQEIKGFAVIHNEMQVPSILVITDKYMHSPDILIKGVKRYLFFTEFKTCDIDIYNIKGELLDSFGSKRLKQVEACIKSILLTMDNQEKDLKTLTNEQLKRRFTDLEETQNFAKRSYLKAYFEDNIGNDNLNFD